MVNMTMTSDKILIERKYGQITPDEILLNVLCGTLNLRGKDLFLTAHQYLEQARSNGMISGQRELDFVDAMIAVGKLLTPDEHLYCNSALGYK